MLDSENAREIPSILEKTEHNENAIVEFLDEIAVQARSASFREACNQQIIIDSVMSKATVEEESKNIRFQAYRALANLCIDNDLNRGLVVGSKLWPVLSRKVSRDPKLSKVILTFLYNLSLGNEQHVQECLARSKLIPDLLDDPPISDEQGFSILISILESLMSTEYFVEQSDWFISCLLALPHSLECNDKVIGEVIEAYLAINPEKVKISGSTFTDLINYVMQIESNSDRDLFVGSICYLSKNLSSTINSSDEAIKILTTWLVQSESSNLTTWAILFLTRFDNRESSLYKDLVADLSLDKILTGKIISYTEHSLTWTSEGICEAFRLLCLLSSDSSAREEMFKSKECVNAVISVLKFDKSDLYMKSWALTLLRLHVSEQPKMVVDILARDPNLEQCLIVNFPTAGLVKEQAERQQEAYFSIACILKALLQDQRHGKDQIITWNKMLNTDGAKYSFIQGMQSILIGHVKFKPMQDQAIVTLSIMAALQCGLETIESILDRHEISRIFTDDKNTDRDIKHNMSFLVVTLKSNGRDLNMTENLRILDERVQEYLQTK